MKRALMRNPLSALLFCLVAHAQLADAADVLELSAGVHRIEAEVAGDFGARAQGLMNRRSMPPNRGMLFVFPRDAQHCMWMRNTYIPLSVAFLDERGAVINVAEMEPRTETNHCAARPARYALEMNRGWFLQRGIKPGTKINGIDKAPAPE